MSTMNLKLVSLMALISAMAASNSGCSAVTEENDSEGESGDEAEIDAADLGEDEVSQTADGLVTCTIPAYVASKPKPVGWASMNGGTTGGGAVAPIVVTTLADFNDAAKGTNKAVIHVAADLGKGTATIGSNKTIIGCSGKGVLRGHVSIKKATNVIIRNLNIVGYNCAPPDVDVKNGGECQNGEDAVTVEGSKNIWFDHDAISDGSDGNLDVKSGSDFITISHTKFFYSTKRTDPNDTGAAGHRYSNLIGSSDDNGAQDGGKLNITWHGNWWGQYVVERQARIRFGKNHFFNNLWDSTTANYCIRVGVEASILSENNAFVGVKTPIDISSVNSKSSAKSKGNSYVNTTGAAPADYQAAKVFVPPYTYTAAAASGVAASVKANAGPK